MDACQKSVLKYLTDQNRPYSANDIVLNMHKEHGKTAVQKALDGLVAETKVVEKVSCQVLIFFVLENCHLFVSGSSTGNRKPTLSTRKTCLQPLKQNLWL